MRTDFVIIGAGPAGSAAAIHARRFGLSVVLLEASSRFRPAPGETLHPGVEPLFEQLGIRDAVLAGQFHRHRGIWIEWDGPRRFESYGEDDRGPWRGFQADRERLHTILLQAAVDAGAELVRPASPVAVLRDGVRVAGVEADGLRFFARWTADATGRRAWLARALELREERHSPPLYVRFGWNRDERADLDGQPLFAAHEQGWNWQAPLGDRTAWAELRIDDAAERPPGGQGADLSWRIHRDSAGPGYFLLGDAAATLDPASSHGVLRALMSGVLAAHLAAGCVNRDLPEPVAFEEYRNWCEQQFETDIHALRTLYAKHPAESVARAFAQVQSGKPGLLC
ncbi:MAG: NAD(P)/FAD-dependent oxidoreductase [Bryobacteraceae bacterium]